MENAKKFYEMDDESQQLKQNAEAELKRLVQNKKFTTLLDVGCGDGHFLNNFPNKKLLGIDINKGMLKLAKNLQGKLKKIDIVKNKEFVKINKNSFEIITANYVFTELRKKEIEKAFKNIFQLLHNNGRFCFTITNPTTRINKEFPGYKLQFKEEYSYHKEDLPFTVLLKNTKGKYVDVGIRDIHQPIEIYEKLLLKAGFTIEKKEEISTNHEYSYAILYEVKKQNSKIAIVGSATHTKTQQYIKEATKIFKEKNVELLTGAGIGLPQQFVQEGKKARIRSTGYSPAKNEIEHNKATDNAP